MPRTRCPHCNTIQPFEEEERGDTKQCTSCEGAYRVPGAAKDKAVQPASKSQPKAETAGRGPVKRQPPAEEDMDELDEVVAADDEEDEDEREQEEERPRKRRPKKDADDDKPRRRKNRRRQPEGFSLVDTLPIDYISQVNIGVTIYVIVEIMVFLGTSMVRHGSPAYFLLMLAALFGACSLLWACAAYAKNKNYSQWLGLLGLLSLLGLIVLVILPTRPDPEDET